VVLQPVEEEVDDPRTQLRDRYARAGGGGAVWRWRPRFDFGHNLDLEALMLLWWLAGLERRNVETQSEELEQVVRLNKVAVHIEQDFDVFYI